MRQSTLNKSNQHYRLSIAPHLGDVRLDKLTVQVLNKWKTSILSQGNSHISNQNVYGELRALLNYAVRLEYLPHNPLLKVGNFKQVYDTDQKEKLHFYTPEQFMQFNKISHDIAVQSDAYLDWCYYVFFNVAFYTGARKGEIHAMKWSDIDGDIWNIRRSIAQKMKGGDVETPPKNKSSYRSIQLPTPLMDILNEHKLRQSELSGFCEDWRAVGGMNCLRDTTLGKRNTKFSELAELPHIRIHDFRHTHASLLINHQINIQEISRRLGHSNVEMTLNTYSHLYPKETEKALQVLNSIRV